MRHRTYLNVILTVNAVLVGGLLWTQIVDKPAPASAVAQSRSVPNPGLPRVKMTDALTQRQEIIASLEGLRRSVDASRRMLEKGQVKVEVTNLDEISKETDRNR